MHLLHLAAAPPRAFCLETCQHTIYRRENRHSPPPLFTSRTSCLEPKTHQWGKKQSYLTAVTARTSSTSVNHPNDILYYEMLDLPLAALEQLKILKVCPCLQGRSRSTFLRKKNYCFPYCGKQNQSSNRYCFEGKWLWMKQPLSMPVCLLAGVCVCAESQRV